MSELLRFFKIVLRGENFILSINDENHCMGFHIIRYVKAHDPEEGENLILRVLMKDIKKEFQLLNNEFNPPRIFTEEIIELDSFLGIDLPGSEFLFYEED